MKIASNEISLRASQGTQARHGEAPVASLVGGSRPYLWLGDETQCFVTLGKREARKLKKLLDEWLDDGAAL